jgi:hypothetical protein
MDKVKLTFFYTRIGNENTSHFDQSKSDKRFEELGSGIGLLRFGGGRRAGSIDRRAD